MDEIPDGGAAPQLARQMWSLFEPVHAVTYFLAYFSPEARAAYASAGSAASGAAISPAAAPLGAIGEAPVTAAFFSFAAPMVGRARPAIWPLITPSDALRVRSAGAVRALRRLLSPINGSAEAGAARPPACSPG